MENQWECLRFIRHCINFHRLSLSPFLACPPPRNPENCYMANDNTMSSKACSKCFCFTFGTYLILFRFPWAQHTQNHISFNLPSKLYHRSSNRKENEKKRLGPVLVYTFNLNFSFYCINYYYYFRSDIRNDTRTHTVTDESLVKQHTVAAVGWMSQLP